MGLSNFERSSVDGVVTMAEFVEYYRDISAEIDDDEYFELMMRNAWHISGGEGAAANSSCLRVLVIHTDDSMEVVEVTDDLGSTSTASTRSSPSSRRWASRTSRRSTRTAASRTRRGRARARPCSASR